MGDCIKRHIRGSVTGFSISGPNSAEYSPLVHSLLSGKLPEGWEWVESSKNSLVARRSSPSPIYYKEYVDRSAFERIKALFRGDRCLRAIKQGDLLQQKGFRSPSVLCWGGQGRRHFVITEGVPSVGLYDFLLKHRCSPAALQSLHTKRRIIAELGREVGRLHSHGICHGDLRLNNILIEQTGTGVTFHFIDNERNRFLKTISRRLVEKNLVQLNMVSSLYLTRQDRLRFFRAYLTAYPRFSPREAKLLALRVHRKTLKRMAKRPQQYEPSSK